MKNNITIVLSIAIVLIALLMVVACSDPNNNPGNNEKQALEHYQQGITYSDQGQFDLAISEFSKAIEIVPNMAEAYSERGKAYGRLGQSEQAIADLDKAIEINEGAQKFDGIERILDDGTVVFTEKAFKIMEENLGYSCKELNPDESEKRYD